MSWRAPVALPAGWTWLRLRAWGSLSTARLLLLCLLLVRPLPAGAAEGVSVSGRLSARAVCALDDSSVSEEPGLNGRLVMDAGRPGWRLYSWLEGGWDGLIASDNNDSAVLKNGADVYQDNNPFLEIKELYGERSLAGLEARVGIQRFAWGRLDEYPINDLFNPWDYRQFLLKSLEERKIGVPALSLVTSRSGNSLQLVWTPWLVPYRLPGSDERWALFPAEKVPGASQPEPDLPPHTLDNGSLGLRWQNQGEVEWALNLFHGFDPRPAFAMTATTFSADTAGAEIVPQFQRITSIGLDGAMVAGDWSLRAETAYACNRAFTVRQELWTDPQLAATETRDTLDYGLAADYRPFEDGLLTLQAQQTVIIDRPETLYDQSVETILWVNLKVGWLNQKVDTTLNLAWNPEHGATMIRPGVHYVINDFWKIGLTGLLLDGPPQSLFGRYAQNDQVMLELVYSW